MVSFYLRLPPRLPPPLELPRLPPDERDEPTLLPRELLERDDELYELLELRRLFELDEEL